MKKHFILIFGLVLIFSCTSQQVSQTVGVINDTLNKGKPLTSSEVASGLKEALVKGITSGVVQASATDGFLGNPKLKIPFPEDARKVENTLRDLGLGGEVDKFVTTLNRGAEEAAEKAKPIFVSAIKNMTIQDAFQILKGEDNAATEYLRRNTEAQLVDAFKPVMRNSLEQVNATKYWSELITRYNRIPLVQKVDPELDSYATQKAVDGLFVLIAQEEGKIREDPLARTTDLLKRVFGSPEAKQAE